MRRAAARQTAFAIALRIWCHVRARKQKWLSRSLRPNGISLVRDWKACAEISVANRIHRIDRRDARRGSYIRRYTAAQCEEDRGYDASPWKLNQTPPMQATHYTTPRRGAP